MRVNLALRALNTRERYDDVDRDRMAHMDGGERGAHTRSPIQDAASEALDYMARRVGGHGGLIAVDADGDVAVQHSTVRMAWAMRVEGGGGGSGGKEGDEMDTVLDTVQLQSGVDAPE